MQVHHKKLLVDATWLVAVAATIAALFTAGIVHLDSLRENTRTLRGELEARGERVQPAPVWKAAIEEREELEQLLLARRELVTNESRRIEELARAARATGVSLVGLKNEAPKSHEESALLSAGHELEALGDYRQLAEFLSRINAAPGSLSVDRFEILAEDEDSNELSATLRVTWHAADLGAVPATPEEGQ